MAIRGFTKCECESVDTFRICYNDLLNYTPCLKCSMCNTYIRSEVADYINSNVYIHGAGGYDNACIIALREKGS